jgi:hypothetical protein
MPSVEATLRSSMSSSERLTIDATVARDYLDSRREGHVHAVELFALARKGEIELAAAPQGYRLDAQGNLAETLRATFETESVAIATQLSYPSEVTYPSDDLFPGSYVEGFSEAWADVVATWRSHEGKPPEGADRFHVQTHVFHGRDVFLTDDRSLRAMCRRLCDEHSIPVVALSPAEYLEARSARHATGSLPARCLAPGESTPGADS